MLEYEFERVHAEMGGYSIFGGIGIETEGHREVIFRRAAEGWGGMQAGFRRFSEARDTLRKWIWCLCGNARMPEQEEAMEQTKIDRINELARKAKSPEGLTQQEEQERAALRREYVDAVLGNLQGQLDHTYLQRPDGSKEKLKKKEE